jgi:hypothetical protein
LVGFGVLHLRKLVNQLIHCWWLEGAGPPSGPSTSRPSFSCVFCSYKKANKEQ